MTDDFVVDRTRFVGAHTPSRFSCWLNFFCMRDAEAWMSRTSTFVRKWAMRINDIETAWQGKSRPCEGLSCLQDDFLWRRLKSGEGARTHVRGLTGGGAKFSYMSRSQLSRSWALLALLAFHRPAVVRRLDKDVRPSFHSSPDWCRSAFVCLHACAVYVMWMVPMCKLLSYAHYD